MTTITGPLRNPVTGALMPGARISVTTSAPVANASATYPQIALIVTAGENAEIALELAAPATGTFEYVFRIPETSPSPIVLNIADGSPTTLHALIAAQYPAVAPSALATHAALTSTAHGGIVRPPLAMSFSGNGDIYFVAHEPMTLTTPVEAGTGTLAYTRALAAAPTSFSTLAFPGTLAVGDILKVTLTGISGYKAATLPRSA
jgi:hypothetical protein